MVIKTVGGKRIGISDVNKWLTERLPRQAVGEDLAWARGSRRLSKQQQGQLVSAPYSMEALLNLADLDEYVAGCVDALAIWSLQKAECRDQSVMSWLSRLEGSWLELLQEFVKNYTLCGNGLFTKVRSGTGQWVGISRLLPNEVTIYERYDANGFLNPDYVQMRSGQRTLFPGEDVIHMKKSHRRSNLWGISSLPVVQNVDILSEIKTYDYNNFKNGLLLDYFLIVEGGSLRDNMVTEDDGSVAADAYSLLESALRENRGNDGSHATVLLESESKDVKIRLEPLRNASPEGAFLNLKQDLRTGIFSYYRVPPRLVSQMQEGQLGGGGEVEGQMKLFYYGAVKPLQNMLAETLSREFREEFKSNVQAADWDFGNLDELFMASADKLFEANL